MQKQPKLTTNSWKIVQPSEGKSVFLQPHLGVLLTFKKLPMDPTHRHSRCLPDTKKSNDLRRCGFQKTDPFLLMVNTSALGSDLHQVIYKGCNLFLSFSNDRVSGNICFKNEGVLYVTKFICSNYHLLPQEMELLMLRNFEKSTAETVRLPRGPACGFLGRLFVCRKKG